MIRASPLLIPGFTQNYGIVLFTQSERGLTLATYLTPFLAGIFIQYLVILRGLTHVA